MSDSMTEEEKKLLEDIKNAPNEFEDNSDDFGFFDPYNTYPYYPDLSDLEFPSEPPPVPKEALEKDKETLEEDKCKHKETKKVYITNHIAYVMCKACKADLGDAE